MQVWILGCSILINILVILLLRGCAEISLIVIMVLLFGERLLLRLSAADILLVVDWFHIFIINL